jgi:arginase
MTTSARILEVIVVPYEVDRGDTGMARAPEEILARGLLEGLDAERGIIRTEIRLQGHDAARGGAVAATVAATVAELGRETARAVANARGRGRFPLILSGGCISAVGVVAGLQRMGRDVGAVWLDAHGDFNTPESSPSGYWDGMALAAVCGRSLPEVFKPIELRPLHFRNVVHLGGRAFDPPEIDDIRRLHLTVVPSDEVGTEATRTLIAQAADGANATRDFYLHLDLDGLDPREAPAVNRPVPNGPSVEDLFFALRGQTPAAMTLAGMDFDRVDEARAQHMLATCRRLLAELT